MSFLKTNLDKHKCCVLKRQVFYSIQAAITKPHAEWLIKDKFISHIPGGWKSEMPG